MPTPAELRRLAYQLLQMADSLESGQLTQVDTESKTESMQQSQKEAAPAKRHRGRPLESVGPYAKVARARGLSLRGLALAMGWNYHSIKTRDQRLQITEEHRAALDALPPVTPKKK